MAISFVSGYWGMPTGSAASQLPLQSVIPWVCSVPPAPASWAGTQQSHPLPPRTSIRWERALGPSSVASLTSYLGWFFYHLQIQNGTFLSKITKLLHWEKRTKHSTFKIGVSLWHLRRGWNCVRCRDYPPSTSLTNQVKEGFYQGSVRKGIRISLSISIISNPYSACTSVLLKSSAPS